MARRGRSRRSGDGMGFSTGRLLSTKNIMYTLAGAYLAPKIIGVDSKIGAAVGGYMGAGIAGAAAGYFVSPFLMGTLNGVLARTTTVNGTFPGY